MFLPTGRRRHTLFDLVHIETSGRVVTAHLADFDGDGRTDLMLVALDGVPPLESRTISVHLQQADGEFAESGEPQPARAALERRL